MIEGTIHSCVVSLTAEGLANFPDPPSFKSKLLTSAVITVYQIQLRCNFLGRKKRDSSRESLSVRLFCSFQFFLKERRISLARLFQNAFRKRVYFTEMIVFAETLTSLLLFLFITPAALLLIASSVFRLLFIYRLIQPFPFTGCAYFAIGSFSSAVTSFIKFLVWAIDIVINHAFLTGSAIIEAYPLQGISILFQAIQK